MRKGLTVVLVLVLMGWTGSAFALHQMDMGDMPAEGKVHQHAPMTQHYEDSIFKVTDNGDFSVEVLFPDKKVEMGVNRVDLIVHNREDKDVAGATITVTPWMPSMGHGVMEKPVVREKGGGLYNVSNVVFSMTGDWELRLEISSGKATDTVNIPLPAVGAMGHTHTMKAPDKSRIDTSKEVMSHMGLFKISYRSVADPVPVGRIITWELTVRTPDGKPVKGADIRILGDMPEHGHGLPTVPEVTETGTDGVYAVEGLKFSMPGWWVVTFHIQAGDMTDHVSFNLLLN
jgi:hypothetical protein